MPDLTLWGLFVVASMVLLLKPGPAVLYIVARSVEQGRAAGLVSVLGIISTYHQSPRRRSGSRPSSCRRRLPSGALMTPGCRASPGLYLPVRLCPSSSRLRRAKRAVSE